MEDPRKDAAASGGIWRARLRRWYGRNRRRLPWRRRAPRPYEVWVSEIMLQQTRVAAVAPYFRRFRAAFPDAARLAAADLQEVLKLWEGLGYYARARNLHRAARELAARGAVRYPRTAREWRRLPGIGPYTAAAIASIAFGERVPVVDGNVMRVFIRFLGLAAHRRSVRAGRRIETFLSAALPRRRPGDFNQAIMELGALVCRARAPRCPACPLAEMCRARRRGRENRLPLRTAPRRLPHVEVVAGIVRRNGRILISRRRADQMLGGLWEFPGGKLEPGETAPQALVRELREETGLRIRVGVLRGTVRHAYTHFRITLHAYDAVPAGGRARPITCDAVRWVRPSELSRYPFPAADRRILEQLGQAPIGA